MRELGAASTSEHEALGRLTVRLGVNRLVVVGDAARPIHVGAQSEGMSVYVDSATTALHLLRNELRPGDVVLVKASRAVGLERLAAELIGATEAGTG
jgi:UDP-N-acetylmuramoyl-tripeptide--D-alanyl-D-alanine ligase